jgi:hypothetical protein
MKWLILVVAAAVGIAVLAGQNDIRRYLKIKRM